MKAKGDPFQMSKTVPDYAQAQLRLRRYLDTGIFPGPLMPFSIQADLTGLLLIGSVDLQLCLQAVEVEQLSDNPAIQQALRDAAADESFYDPEEDVVWLQEDLSAEISYPLAILDAELLELHYLLTLVTKLWRTDGRIGVHNEHCWSHEQVLSHALWSDPSSQTLTFLARTLVDLAQWSDAYDPEGEDLPVTAALSWVQEQQLATHWFPSQAPIVNHHASTEDSGGLDRALAFVLHQLHQSLLEN